MYSDACGAEAVEEQVVTENAKAAWQFMPDRGEASFQFVDLVAVLAKKMVVVLLARHLVARRFPRNLNRNQPLLLNHGLQVAINRRNAQIVHAALGVGENLVRSERAICLDKSRANRILLPSVSR